MGVLQFAMSFGRMSFLVNSFIFSKSIRPSLRFQGSNWRWNTVKETVLCISCIMLCIFPIPDSIQSVGRFVDLLHSIIFLKSSNLSHELSLFRTNEVFNDLCCCSICWGLKRVHGDSLGCKTLSICRSIYILSSLVRCNIIEPMSDDRNANAIPEYSYTLQWLTCSFDMI